MSLEKAKIGDYIVLDNYGAKSLIKIDKITKTMVACGSTRFRKNGRKVSAEKWGQNNWVKLADEADIKTVRAQMARRYIEKHASEAPEDLAMELAILLKKAIEEVS